MNQQHNGSAGKPFRAHLYLLSAVFLFVFMGAGAQQAYLVPYLSRVTDWGSLRCSSIVACVYGSMLVFRVLNVYLFARWTDRRFTIVGSFTYLLFTLAMLAVPFVRSYPLAIAFACLWGAGGAMMWTGTAMQTLALADEAGNRHGTGIGILYASTHAGWLTGVVVLGLIYRSLPVGDLHVLYVVAAALTLVGNALACFLPAGEQALRETPPWRQLVHTVLRQRALIAGLLQMTAALAFGLVLGSFGKYVQDQYGPQWIWLAIAFYPGTRMVLSLMGGIASDRLGHTAVLCAGFLSAAAGLAALVLWHSPYAAILAALCLGLLSSVVPIVASAIVGAAADTRRRPIVYGLIFAWRDLGVVAASLGVNILGLRFELETAFTVFIFIFIGCSLLSVYLGRFKAQTM